MADRAGAWHYRRWQRKRPGGAVNAPGPAREDEAPMQLQSIPPTPVRHRLGLSQARLVVRPMAALSRRQAGQPRARQAARTRQPRRADPQAGRGAAAHTHERRAPRRTRRAAHAGRGGCALPAPPDRARAQALDADGLRIDAARPPRPVLRPRRARPHRARARRGVHGRQGARRAGAQERAQLRRAAALDLRARPAARLGDRQPLQARRQAEPARRPRHSLPRHGRARGAAARRARRPARPDRARRST